MNKNYVVQMREKGLKDEEIKTKLNSAGWQEDEIKDLFSEADDDSAPPPPPHKTNTQTTPEQPADPVAVVERYTTVGIEYTIMFLALAIGAISLGALLHNYLDVLAGRGSSSWGSDMAGVAAIVSIPLFLFLFIRLKRAEARNLKVRSDSSRRRGVQLALIVSFLWGIKSVVFYLYGLMYGQRMNDYDYYKGYINDSISSAEYQALQFGHLLITLLIAGGIFAYYWIDEHKHKS